MPKTTLQERLSRGLLHLGYSEIPRSQLLSSRYRVFDNGRRFDARTHRPIRIYVGSNGALRAGTSASNSYACTDAFRLQVLQAFAELIKLGM